jgi:hypothetical protein
VTCASLGVLPSCDAPRATGATHPPRGSCEHAPSPLFGSLAICTCDAARVQLVTSGRYRREHLKRVTRAAEAASRQQVVQRALVVQQMRYQGSSTVGTRSGTISWREHGTACR